MEKAFEMFVRIGGVDTKVVVIMQIRAGWPDDEASIEGLRIFDERTQVQMPLSWLLLESDRLRVEERAWGLAQDLNESAALHAQQAMMDSRDEQEREG